MSLLYNGVFGDNFIQEEGQVCGEIISLHTKKKQPKKTQKVVRKGSETCLNFYST